MLWFGLMLGQGLLGALSYRLRGGGFISDYPGRRPVDLSLWSGVVCAPLLWHTPLLGFAAAIGCGVFSSLSHGSGLDFGRSEADDPDELWRYAWAPMDSPWADFKFMAVSGLLISVGPGLIAGGLLGWPWAVLALSGVLKAPSYGLGYLAWKRSYRGDTTALAELTFGAALGLSFGICWLEVI